jgi:predicted ATP-grasp superfamily ATP-dependent carboligase
VPLAAPEGPALVDALVKLAARLTDRPVLILTSDQAVNTVSEYRREIQLLYRISLPSPDMVLKLSDKTLFQVLAEQEGFLVPRSVCVTESADIARLAALRPPLLVKPADKTLVLKGIVERAVRAATLADAQRITTEMLSHAPRIVVQEWIDGPDSEIFFTLFSCDRNGRLLGLFTGRKLLSSPPQVGNTAVCMAAPEIGDELIAPTLQFIVRTGYCGLGSLEFKRDRRTGKFLVIEPTVGRTDWQEEIATLCGVNLPLITYRSELGEPLPAARGSLPPVAWRSSVRFRVPLARRVPTIDGFLRWSDPLPAVYQYAYERGLRRLYRRVKRAVRSSHSRATKE